MNPYRYPDAPRGDVVDVRHGLRVPDPYRWLEDGDTTAVKEWQEAQLALADTHLAGLRQRAAFTERLGELTDAGLVSTPVWRGERYFQVRRPPGAEFGVVHVVSRDGARPLLDPLAIDPTGGTTLDGWRVSPDGDRIAYQLSTGGTEQSLLRVLDVDTGENIDGPIDRTRYTPVAWLPDGGGYYYVRRLPPEEVPGDERSFHRRVWLHHVGTDPDTDTQVFGADCPVTASYQVDLFQRRWLLVSVTVGTSPHNDVYLADLGPDAEHAGAPAFTPVQRDLGESTIAWVGRDRRLYLRTTLGAPRGRLCVADPADPGAPEDWTELVAEDPEAVLGGVTLLDAVDDRGPLLFVVHTRHAVREASIAAAGDGRRVAPVRLPPAGWIGHPVEHPDGGTRTWFTYTDYTTPPMVLNYDARDGCVRRWAGVADLPSLPRVYTRQAVYRSADDTEVRLFLITPASCVDGPDEPRPTVLTGYGGFGVPMAPRFRPDALAWAAAGGVFAIACLRGGDEEGAEWHEAGTRERKQNVFDDFHAAARWLVAEGWTTPAQLGISGGSNGGLLVGAALTQRPELYGAVVCSAPLLDMTRYELMGLGALWRKEYGSAEIPEELAWLLAYSPYHNVRDGVAYPPTMFQVYDGDTRVDPMHARKMAAAMQHADVGRGPILFRSVAGVGHGARSRSRGVRIIADTLAFLAEATGLGRPEEEGTRTLMSVDELRAVSEPIRHQTLRIVAAEPNRWWDASELAARVGVRASLMHYHLDLLVAERLLRAELQPGGWRGRRQRRYACAFQRLRWSLPDVS